MPPPLEIIPYSADRLGEVLEVINLSLGEKSYFNRDANYWQWKHELNPHGRSLMWLGLHKNCVVGVRAFMRWEFQIEGKIIQAAKPVDSATHPSCQRMGIFSQLTRTACEQAHEMNIDLIYNTPNKKSLPGYLKLGWNSVGQLPLLVRVTKPFTLSWKLLTSKLRSPSDRIPTEEFFREKGIPASQMFEKTFPLDQFLSRINHAVSSEEHRLTTPKSRQFIQWRYGSHPHIDYFIERVAINGQLAGILVYRLNTRWGLREIMITDLLIDLDYQQVEERLFKQLLDRVQCEYIVAQALPQTRSYCMLKQLRFKKAPKKGFHLVSRAVTNEQSNQHSVATETMDISKWNLCLGDLEGL